MNLKVRLAVMNFLGFVFWGVYLSCMGNYLGVVGFAIVVALAFALIFKSSNKQYSKSYASN